VVRFEALCLLFIEQPDFVQEMIDFWAEFVLNTLAPVLTRVELDNVIFSEDMAYKEHSMLLTQDGAAVPPAHLQALGSGCQIQRLSRRFQWIRMVCRRIDPALDRSWLQLLHSARSRGGQ